MKYNSKHIIEYTKLDNDDDDEMNDAYRDDFLKCFKCESYDDTVDDTITKIYNMTHMLPGFTELYSQTRLTYSISNDDEFCIVYLFNYENLGDFHTIISSYINNNEIQRENIDNLIEKLKRST